MLLKQNQYILQVVFFSRYIDQHKQDFINNLKEAVAIKSVSAWPDTRNEIIKMMKWVAKVKYGLILLIKIIIVTFF